MSSTDELRQLLDKHGIEWWSDGDISSDHTEWATDSMSFTSLGMDGDKLAIKTITAMTPRQALDATLGRVIRDDTLRRECEARMALQREYNNQCERIRNQRKNLKEMQAALERKTCHDLCDERIFHCSECGFGFSDVYLSDENYLWDDEGKLIEPWPPFCPNCGRKVVE